MEGHEWDVPTHSTVKMGSGAEATAIGSRGGEVGHRQSFQRLLAPPGDGDLLQIPGTGDLGGRRRMDGGGKELVPGKGVMEEDDANPQQGGSGATGVRNIFRSRGAGGDALWFGDLGGHPPHWKGPGGSRRRNRTGSGHTPRQRQNMVAQYITTCSLLDLCEGLERESGEQVGMQ